ncbi:MAG: metallophosphoesterase [Bacteroidales bacterium]|nr:metallophosphoesterase [Bacteroidales bacterium]
MEYPIKSLITFLLLISFAFNACEELDVRGMFISYESVNNRFEQSMEWNASHPFREIIVSSNNYSILSMGDSHVGSTTNLDIFFKNARGTNASAVVLVGDITSGHAEDYEIFQQHLPDQDSLPSFPIIGNHDLYFNGWTQFYSRFGSSTYIFTIKTNEATDLFICLDTGGGTLGNKQLDWLENKLQTLRSDYRHCIVFTHNNFFRFRHTSSTNPLVEELQILMDLFTKYQVNMVVTGHDHEHDVELFGNTTYIVMDALKDGLSNAGYVQLIINNGIIEYNFINL